MYIPPGNVVIDVSKCVAVTVNLKICEYVVIKNNVYYTTRNSINLMIK